MRKNATKIAALALSLALTVTSVNVPTNASAASVKLNKTKATLYLNGPSKKKVSKLVVKGTNKKVTFTSSNKSVVKVNKNGKITAKATGKATITAKVNKKSYKCNVTVKKTYKPVTGITVSPKTVTLNVGKKKTLKTTVKPAKPTNKKVAYTSDKKSVATVSSAGKITAKKAGTAKITVKTKGIDKNNKHKKATVAVTVKDPDAPDASTAPSDVPSTEPSVEPSAEPSAEPTTPAVTNGNISVKLTDSMPGRDDTVLAGTSAVFQVSVKDANGNPAANQSAVISLEKDGAASDAEYVLSDATTVVTTDANGTATFVVKPKGNGTVKNTQDEYVGAYKYTVKVGEESAEGVLKVAAIAYGVKSGKSVENLNVNGSADYSDIVPGSNVDKDNSTYKRETKNIKGQDVQYVGAQQVSRGDENKVAFQTDVFLKIPAYSGEKEPAKDAYQELNLKSEKYHTYASAGSTTQSKDLDQKDLSDVAYATVRFNSLKLSKHTKAVVTLKYSNGSTKAVASYGYDDVTFEQGEGFGLQLKKDDLKDAVSISFSLEARGQVDLGSNDGYDVKDIVYVFNSQKKNEAEYVHYDGVNVDWEIEDKVYYDDEIQLQTNGTPVTSVVNTGEAAYYDDSQATKLVKDATAIVKEIKDTVNSEDDCYNITYSAPAFPDTGNAIIKCYDRNNKVKKYFACATVNNGKNVNVLYFNTGDAKKNLLYEITEQEAVKSTDCDIVEKDPEKGLVVVNAKKSGVTHLKGTVSSDDPKISAVLDAENIHVYTSVMWNPVIDSSNNAAGIALAGQTATVVAQLIDDNGNPVAQSGEPINWTLPTDYKNKGIKDVDIQPATDPKGQAALKLSAANAAELIGVNASTPSGYKVKLILADEESTKGADIYWIDLHLEYKASAIKDPMQGQDADTTKTGTDSGKATAKVGEKWEYATRVIARSVDKDGNSVDKFQAGALKGKTVASVAGILPTLSKQPSSKGTVEIDSQNGWATVTSDVVTDNSAIIFRLNNSNKPADGALVVIDGKEYKLIGTGNISANETLTLNYVFETVGSEIGFLTPNGNKSAEDKAVGTDTQIIYLQLRDSKGNPITLKNETDCKDRIRISVASKSGNATIDTISATDGYQNTVAQVDDYQLLKKEETGYLGEGSTSKEAIYTTFSKVSKDGSTVGDPNTDGILAVKLKDTVKEDVVVTATYEEVRGKQDADSTKDTRTVNVITTQTQSYSFVDDEKLPEFTFDTAQDNGRNRIYYDSDKNEIIVAFKNDLLASSVKADQFIVQRAKSSDDGVTLTDTENLVVKDVTVDGNKAIIKLTGNLTNLTDETYFKVFVGIATNDAETYVFDKSIRYIFTSEDGQELGSKKSIVFPADSKKSIEGQFVTETTTALDSLDLSDADKVAEAVELLALAGVDIPVATVDDETKAYLKAIKANASSASTPEELQKKAKEAIEEVKSDKKVAEDAIQGNSTFKGKQLKGSALKKAAANPGITVKNAVVSGSAISVAVTTTGSAIKVAYEPVGGTISAFGSSVASTSVNPEKSGTVYFQANSESVNNCEVAIVITTKYYTRTYTITGFTVTKDGNDYVIIGGKVKDEMRAYV